MLQGLQSASQLGPLSLVTAGAIAGSTFWALVYPADAVKSRIQIDDFKNPRYKGTIDCFRKVLSTLLILSNLANTQDDEYKDHNVGWPASSVYSSCAPKVC